MTIPANIEFFFRLATSKAVAKLQAAGYDRDQIAEYLTRPGHLASLAEHAKELHFQAIEAFEENPEGFARDVRREYDARKHEAAYPGF